MAEFERALGLVAYRKGNVLEVAMRICDLLIPSVLCLEKNRDLILGGMCFLRARQYLCSDR